MTDQTPENTQLFLTAAMPCPYLPGRQERKLFTHLTGRRAATLHHLLSDNGFRRSQNLIYRPACDGCGACQSVRIVAREFEPTARYRRVLAANSDVVATVRHARATAEQFALFKRYLEARHSGGGMTQMSYVDYEYMVEDTPVQTILVEYRLTSEPEQPLVALALTDVMPDGLSMVYSFFDPAYEKRGLGNLLILDHVRQVKLAGLDYVYLGYWVKDSPKMAYKGRFRPLEVQRGPLGGGASTEDLFDLKQLFLSVLRFCAGFAAVGLAALALMALLGFAVPAFDLLNHFQALLFLGLVVSLILCIWLVRGKYRQLVLMIASAGFVASAVVVVPEIVSGLPSRQPAPHDRPTITLLTHNLFGLNYDMKRVEAIIISEDPDILAFQEYFPEQFGDLDPLIRVRYPYSTRCRGGKRANLGLYSKTPFVEEEAASACPDDAFGTQRTAQILAEFELADGRRFSVLTTHLDWPLPLERQRTQMAELVGTLDDIKGPLLVVGDFNSTPWSYALRHFQSATELQRFTRNLVTFPLRFTFRGLIDTLPFLPLDHVFGRGVEVHELYAGAETGSDHLPVIVKFSVE